MMSRRWDEDEEVKAFRRPKEMEEAKEKEEANIRKMTSPKKKKGNSFSIKLGLFSIDQEVHFH
ncbi:hypothetical protein [Escherichia coli]|uniref:hypothetical protein n=1 Tax=Escherichia coli TaxID=562 RepID=UPI0032DBEA38